MHVYNSLTNPEVVKRLLAGEVGVIPTDTLYGLVCRAADQAAVTRLYALKSRDHKPGTLIAATIDQLAELGIPRRYLTPVQQFWPGAVSVETPHHVDYLTQSTGRQGIRIPDHPELLALLAGTGPLQTTSANQPGEPPSTTIAEAQKYFGNSVDFYVDGGDLSGRLPSTIIRVVDDAIDVIREGAVKIDE
jgi:L-threonylcarbamoyladenylate synthase